ETHVVVISDLYHFSDLRFHSRNRLHLGSVGERFCRRIISTLREFNAGAHIVDPRGDELLFHVVVAFHAHAFELHSFHFPVLARHLHVSAYIHHNVAAAHDRFPGRAALRFLRLGVGIGIHPKLDRVIPVAVEAGEKFMVLADFRQLHDLLHHVGGIRLSRWSARFGAAGWVRGHGYLPCIRNFTAWGRRTLSERGGSERNRCDKHGYNQGSFHKGILPVTSDE